MREKLSRLSNPLSPLSYIKGEGCGNTFIIFDYLDSTSRLNASAIKKAHTLLIKEKRDDALILKKESQNDEKLVLTMTVLEPDQSIAEFCGNGARVVCCYLQHKFGDKKLNYYLKTSQGMRKIWWENDLYFVEMGKTRMLFQQSKFINSKFMTFDLGIGIRRFTFYWTETLEPHLVTFDQIHENELLELGLYLNHHQRHYFPLGVNINRAEIVSQDSLRVTTFERGVNRITAACGTGATSCAMLAKALGFIKKSPCIHVFLKNGKICIYPNRNASVMSGPANIDKK